MYLCSFGAWAGWKKLGMSGIRISHNAVLSKGVLGPLFCYLSCAYKSGRAASCVPQVTLLSFSVDSEFTFVDYIKGG